MVRRLMVIVPLLALTLLPAPASAAGPLVQTATLTVAFANTATGYGHVVALSADGNTALIGAFAYNLEVGAAYVFTRSGGGWSEPQALNPTGLINCPVVDVGCWYGISVALSADGNTALIGAQGDNDSIGAAYIFTRSGTTWTQQQRLPGIASPQCFDGCRFGEQVALSGDGTTALIFAAGETGYTPLHVFTRSGGAWSQQQQLSLGNHAQYYIRIALSGDGATALVGISDEDNYTGAALVFTRSGGVWSQQGSKLTGSGFVNCYQIVQCYFGYAVALSNDGNTALIGSTADNNLTGAAFVFTRSGGVWSQQGSKLTASDEVGHGAFGSALALSADGNTALIAAYSNANGGGEAIWLFTRNGSTWSQRGGGVPAVSPLGPCVNYCSEDMGLALSGDATTALTGSIYDGPYGVAYVFSALTAIIVAPAGVTPTFTVGQPVPLAATGTTSGGGAVPLTGGVWQSSDPTIATVDANGNVIGQRPGTVTITYNRDGVVGQMLVTVTAPNPIGITLPSGRSSGTASGGGTPSPAPAPRSMPVGPAASGGTTTPPAGVQPIPAGR